MDIVSSHLLHMLHMHVTSSLLQLAFVTVQLAVSCRSSMIFAFGYDEACSICTN